MNKQSDKQSNYSSRLFNTGVTSILKVLLKQYMSPTGPNKYLRGITTSTTKTDQIELDLFKVKIWKSGKLNFRKG